MDFNDVRLTGDEMIKSDRLSQIGVSFRANTQGERYAVFQCSCGKKLITRLASVKNKNTRSCGCLHREITLARNKSRKTHGLSGSVEYKLWCAMLQRCRDVDNERYCQRGIQICNRWLDFNAFLADMGSRPDGKSIDRIDNDKGYYPENCKWSTYTQQQRNTSVNTILTINCISRTLVDWSEQPNAVNRGTIRSRLKRNWPPEKAVFHPSRPKEG